jgi:K+-transporting ATPase ATPase C chain
MRKTLIISIRFTLFTALLLGVIYPLAVTGLGHFIFRNKADGQLVVRNGQVIGSQIIGQAFTSDRYFHSRPSAAGNGYDATASGGSNFGPSNQKLITRIQGDVGHYSAGKDSVPVPIDLVTASGSGLDPDISPAAAFFQVHRVAATRKLSDDAITKLVTAHVEGRQFGFLGEPRVNVLALNESLDELAAPQ